MNPYMELPKLNQPAHDVARRSAFLDQEISVSAYRTINAAEALGNIVRRFFEAGRQRREIRASITALSALNDRTLKDIGIDRSEIRSVVEETQRAKAAGTAGRTPRVDRIVSVQRALPGAANDNAGSAEGLRCA